MGNFIGSAVVPICMAITWKDCNAMGAIAGAWSGLIAAIVAWVSVASQQKITVGDDCKSVVNVQTLGIIEPQLAGNLCALCVSAFVAIVCGLAAPQNFDWPALSLPVGDDGVFDLGYFKFWVALAFIWGHFAFLVTVILPIYEYFFGGWEADWEVEATAAKMQQYAPQQPMGFMMNPQGMPMQMPMQMPQSMPMQMPMQSMPMQMPMQMPSYGMAPPMPMYR